MQEVLTLARPLASKLRTRFVRKVRVLRAMGMRLMVAAALTLPAFASDNGGGSGSGSGELSTVISATDTVTTMVGKAWDLTLSNPLTRVYVAAGLLSVGIGFLAYLRRAARH